ncbi:hypothetical protein D3C86_674240 [compost metagenome]
MPMMTITIKSSTIVKPLLPEVVVEGWVVDITSRIMKHKRNRVNSRLITVNELRVIHAIGR